ncbi:hypothetical protein MMC25_004794 [Agyrium rufum]|nr:hypothetical protein [Agyrium rufum]
MIHYGSLSAFSSPRTTPPEPEISPPSNPFATNDNLFQPTLIANSGEQDGKFQEPEKDVQDDLMEFDTARRNDAQGQTMSSNWKPSAAGPPQPPLIESRSPPTMPQVVSQKEYRHPTSFPLPSQPPDVLRGGFNTISPSTSPRPSYRLPVARKPGYQSFGDYAGDSSAGNRSGAPIIKKRFSQGPPLPHLPQSHFNRPALIDDDQLGGPATKSGSSKISFCAFDTLNNTAGSTTAGCEDALLMGDHGSLSVLRVEKDKYVRLGSINGLGGDILSAKLIPYQPHGSSSSGSQPLVVVIIHGPAPQRLSERSHPSEEDISDDPFDATESTLLAMNELMDTEKLSVPFHTRVEIHSLMTGDHICTLFSAPSVSCETGARTLKPLPTGNLSLDAKGRFITVAVGDSGELYIFKQVIDRESGFRPKFTCVGKTWSSSPVRKTRSWSTSSTSSDSDITSDTQLSNSPSPEATIFSLSDRWLAYVPPTPSSRTTLHGKVETMCPTGEAPGVSSHTSPLPPPITCEFDGPINDGALNKIARDVAQEVIRGARWVGDQGVLAFKNYWNKPTDASGLIAPSESVGTQRHPQIFPPTHAHDARQATNRGQTLVSILDLEKLSSSPGNPASSPQPIGTFPLYDGCSFLSFAPHGLMLLSASTNGDVQHVWDLMHILHGKANSPNVELDDKDTTPFMPSIRQVAQYTRLTIARIIEVAWSEPNGERFALVSDRGTVHTFNLPPSAFKWPPPRAKVSSRPSSNLLPDQTNPDSRSLPGAAGSAFSSAMSMVSGSTQPLFAAVRGRPTSISSAINGISNLNLAAGAGAKGSQAMAHGLSKSIGAASNTVSTIRNIGENRVQVPGNSTNVSPGCLKWLRGKDSSHLAVTGDGLLRIHTVREGTSSGQKPRRPSVLGRRPVELRLPTVQSLQKDTRSWRAVSSSVAEGAVDGPHPLSYAEIEANAPYQPFHTDRRVDLHVHADTSESDPHHFQDITPWVFGEDIDTVKVSSGTSTSAELSSLAGHDNHGSGEQMQSHVSMEGASADDQRLVITTRRRRGKANDEVKGNDEDFFEDDCDFVEFADDRV